MLQNAHSFKGVYRKVDKEKFLLTLVKCRLTVLRIGKQKQISPLGL